MPCISELFPKVRKKRKSEEVTTNPGKKRKHSETDNNTKTTKKSSRETQHRKYEQDRKVKKSVKFKPIKKGVRKGKNVKLKRKSKK